MDDCSDATGRDSVTQVELTQLELTIEQIQRESSAQLSLDDLTQESETVLEAPAFHSTNRSVSFGPTTYSQPPYPTNNPVSFPPLATQSSLGEDEIALLEDVDIEISIPSRIISMDFPKADDGHEEDVAKVIRKSFSKLGLRRGQDAISALSRSGLSLGHITLMSQVEAAVEGQEPEDQFWEMVCMCALVCSSCH